MSSRLASISSQVMEPSPSASRLRDQWRSAAETIPGDVDVVVRLLGAIGCEVLVLEEWASAWVVAPMA